MVKGDAARSVLTSEVLVREITVWASGVPGLILEQWKQFDPETKLSRAGGYERSQFLRELWKNRGQNALRLAIDCCWGLSTQRFTWDGFAVCCVQDADVKGLAFLVQHGLLRDFDDEQKTGLWSKALTSLPGSVAVLELLLTHVPPLTTTGETVPTEAWKAWMEDPAMSRKRANEMNTKNTAYTQLLIESLGASSVPEDLIGVEAGRGNMALVKYLHTIPGQKVRSEILRDVYMGLQTTRRRPLYARFTNFRPDTTPALYEMLLFLLQHRRDVSTLWLEEHAFKCGDVSVLKVVDCIRGHLELRNGYRFQKLPLHLDPELVSFLSTRVSVVYSIKAMDEAAASGHWDLFTDSIADQLDFSEAAVEGAARNSHWDVVEELLGLGRTLVLPPTVMDYAARDGRLDIVTRLHETREEGCTSSAFTWAAANGHIEVFRFLREKRAETCTFRAMDSAVKNRRSAVIQLLLESELPALCSTAAMDAAAGYGDLAMVSYLHANHLEGCTTEAIDLAATNGHVEVVKFLLENRTEGFTTKAIEGAMHRGYGKSYRWREWLDNLHDVPRATPHLRTGDRRHVQVLELLYANQPNLFRIHHMKPLLACGAFSIWLAQKEQFPDHGSEEGAMAEAGARGLLSTIRFLVDVQGRIDLLHVALAEAMTKSAAWFGVLRQLYPGSVPSWEKQRGPQLDNTMTYSYDEDEFRRFICLCPEPFQYFEALRAARNAIDIIDRLYEWTPTCEQISIAQENAKITAEASFYHEDGVPDWMIEQDLVDLELTARGWAPDIKDEFGRELTWPIWAVYREDIVALKTISRLALTPKYASDPRFSFANARSRAIRIGRLDILQWLLEQVTHEPVEPTLLHDAIYYHDDVEIALWLAEHCPNGCTEFGRRRPWATPPIQFGLNEFKLDRIEQSEKLRAIVDFGGLAAIAAEQCSVELLKRLHDTYPDAFMARKDLVDRAVHVSCEAADFVTTSTTLMQRLRVPEGIDADVIAAHEAADRVEAAIDAARGRIGTLPVLRYLHEIGYIHVSTIAMDSVRRDDHISVLHYLYLHYIHGGYTNQAIVHPSNQSVSISNANIIRLHLAHHGRTDDHGAWDEAMTLAYTANEFEDDGGFPPLRMWEDLKHYGRWLHANGWKEPMSRAYRAPDFFYKRIAEKRHNGVENKQSTDNA